MTDNLKKFIGVNILLAIPYFFLLKDLIRDPSNTASIATAAIVFTVLLSSSEKYFLNRDNQSKVRFNLRLRYSIASVAISSIVIAAWAFSSAVDPVTFLIAEVVSVAGAILIALLADRKKIKGVKKDELFK